MYIAPVCFNNMWLFEGFPVHQFNYTMLGRTDENVAKKCLFVSLTVLQFIRFHFARSITKMKGY